ncbi:MAG TPA: deaminase [Candidatus Saccharimonadales bacterium]
MEIHNVRLSKKEYFLDMLTKVASRGTCIRRKVAAIITDQDGNIIATGYNGTPRNFDHCIDNPCAGASDRPGDTSKCMALHAEQNALLHCRELREAHTIYCSCLPCFVCSKMLANTNIKVVICAEDYSDKTGLNVLLEAGMSVEITGILIG